MSNESDELLNMLERYWGSREGKGRVSEPWRVLCALRVQGCSHLLDSGKAARFRIQSSALCSKCGVTLCSAGKLKRYIPWDAKTFFPCIVVRRNRSTWVKSDVENGRATIGPAFCRSLVAPVAQPP